MSISLPPHSLHLFSKTNVIEGSLNRLIFRTLESRQGLYIAFGFSLSSSESRKTGNPCIVISLQPNLCTSLSFQCPTVLFQVRHFAVSLMSAVPGFQSCTGQSSLSSDLLVPNIGFPGRALPFYITLLAHTFTSKIYSHPSLNFVSESFLPWLQALKGITEIEKFLIATEIHLYTAMSPNCHTLTSNTSVRFKQWNSACNILNIHSILTEFTIPSLHSILLNMQMTKIFLHEQYGLHSFADILPSV